MSALEAAFVLEVGRGEARFRLEAELQLDAGVLVLFGPSGAGKSLTIAALAGLVRPSSGRIEVRGKVLFDDGVFVPAHQRGIGYVPQRPSLFPFLSVEENVTFGLPRAERRQRTERVQLLLEELDLLKLAAARPATLSGGESQRVALARALAVSPRLLLLDEPLAALDRDARAALRSSLGAFLERWETPAVFVTHSAQEARALADRVVPYERGRTLPGGSPRDILGSGNLRLKARVERAERSQDGSLVVALSAGSLSGLGDERELAEGDLLELSLREPD